MKNGFAFINTDDVYHALTSGKSPCLDELVGEFGEGILNSDSCALDRSKLGEIVFNSKQKLEKLNKIAHYHILKRTEEMIKELPTGEFFGVLVDAPLLFESGFDKKCDFIISVIANEDLRINRIKERDGITEEKAKMRLRAQKSDDFLKNNSHFLIVNDGDINALTKAVDEISEKIKNI